MGSAEVNEGRRLIARLPRDEDLAEAILAVAREHRLELAQVWAIGAVRRARLAYYDQTERKYHEIELDEPLEIVSLMGNISLRDGALALHAHAVFGGRDGRTYGGHVLPGCGIYACELFVVELAGRTLERVHDEGTGLPLWRDLH